MDQIDLNAPDNYFENANGFLQVHDLGNQLQCLCGVCVFLWLGGGGGWVWCLILRTDKNIIIINAKVVKELFNSVVWSIA